MKLVQYYENSGHIMMSDTHTHAHTHTHILAYLAMVRFMSEMIPSVMMSKMV